jgi:hypothetical protein
MSKGIFTKQFDALRPDDEDALAILHTLKMGEAVSVEVKRPRNLKHHRLYWKLMQVVCDNQEHYRNKEELSDAFKIEVGLFTWARGPDRIEYQKPGSISWAKMDQAEFNTFFTKAVNFLCTKVIPGMDSTALRNEVYELLGEP